MTEHAMEEDSQKTAEWVKFFAWGAGLLILATLGYADLVYTDKDHEKRIEVLEATVPQKLDEILKRLPPARRP